jgi:hypothetical protein
VRGYRGAAFGGALEAVILGNLLGFMEKNLTFAVPLPNSIRVVRKILDLYVLVRIQVGQQIFFLIPCSTDYYKGFLFRGLTEV